MQCLLKQLHHPIRCQGLAPLQLAAQHAKQCINVLMSVTGLKEVELQSHPLKCSGHSETLSKVCGQCVQHEMQATVCSNSMSKHRYSKVALPLQRQ